MVALVPRRARRSVERLGEGAGVLGDGGAARTAAVLGLLAVLARVLSLAALLAALGAPPQAAALAFSVIVLAGIVPAAPGERGPGSLCSSRPSPGYGMPGRRARLQPRRAGHRPRDVPGGWGGGPRLAGPGPALGPAAGRGAGGRGTGRRGGAGLGITSGGSREPRPPGACQEARAPRAVGVAVGRRCPRATDLLNAPPVDRRPSGRTGPEPTEEALSGSRDPPSRRVRELTDPVCGFARIRPLPRRYVRRPGLVIRASPQGPAGSPRAARMWARVEPGCRRHSGLSRSRRPAVDQGGRHGLDPARRLGTRGERRRDTPPSPRPARRCGGHRRPHQTRE